MSSPDSSVLTIILHLNIKKSLIFYIVDKKILIFAHRMYTNTKVAPDTNIG